MKRYSEHIISNAKLMAEWDWKENEKEGINPYKLTLGSNKKASWICPKGHKYTKEIYRRTIAGEGCKICSRALRTSFPEQCFFFYTQKVYPDAINSYKKIFKNQMSGT